MKALTKYIIRGTVASLLGVALGETITVAKDAIKIRKQYLKSLKENKEVDLVYYKEAKSGKEAIPVILDSIKTAAKNRVKDIKKDPMAEITALWGCTTFLVGNWKGFFRGYQNGWEHGIDGIDKLIEHFRDKYPIELTNLVKRAIDDKDSIRLSGWSDGDTYHEYSWVAEECDLPKIKEVKE